MHTHRHVHISPAPARGGGSKAPAVPLIGLMLLYTHLMYDRFEYTHYTSRFVRVILAQGPC